MGLRGPPPKPTALEKAEGWPGHRKGKRAAEPTPTELTIAEAKRRCPPDLQKDERRWWRYYAETLVPLNVVSEADLVALARLAKATAERIRFEAVMNKSGPIHFHEKSWRIGKDEKGNPVMASSRVPMLSPLYSVVSGLRDQELKLLREFGMTPASRTNVHAIESKCSTHDQLMELLSQPRVPRPAMTTQ
jgi:P27 family predicted phage terminase small subunit